jgi:hypothetical protein
MRLFGALVRGQYQNARRTLQGQNLGAWGVTFSACYLLGAVADLYRDATDWLRVDKQSTICGLDVLEDAFLHRVRKLFKVAKMFRTIQWGRILRLFRNDWSECQPSYNWKVLKAAGHITFLFDRCPDRAERRVPNDRQETSRPFSSSMEGGLILSFVHLIKLWFQAAKPARRQTGGL